MYKDVSFRVQSEWQSALPQFLVFFSESVESLMLWILHQSYTSDNKIESLIEMHITQAPQNGCQVYDSGGHLKFQ